MNLRELIDCCGFEFRELSLHTPRSSAAYPRWIAKGGKQAFGHWRLFGANTPERAVQKLLNALQARE